MTAAHTILEPERMRVQRRMPVGLRDETATSPIGDDGVSRTPARTEHQRLSAVKKLAGSPDPRRSALPFKQGDVLAGRYAIVKKVARGGMGIVYQAIDRRRAEAGSVYPYVAIKVANIPNVSSAGARNALHREFTRVAGLRHESIVNVIDFDRQGEHFFLVMEWLDGKTLGRILNGAAANAGSGWFDRSLTTRFIEDIATALAYAHRQDVVHADIKPANIFITEEREIKLLDFGNVSLAADGPSGRYFATRAYASCEVLERNQPEASDDVFALGCIAYELLTGRRPFKGHEALEAEKLGVTVEPVEGVGPQVWQAMRAALNYRRQDRPQDAGQFLETWRAPVPQPSVARRPSGRRKAALWTLLAVGVSAGFGVGEIASQSEPEHGAAVSGLHEDRPMRRVPEDFQPDLTLTSPLAAERPALVVAVDAATASNAMADPVTASPAVEKPDDASFVAVGEDMPPDGLVSLEEEPIQEVLPEQAPVAGPDRAPIEQPVVKSAGEPVAVPAKPSPHEQARRFAAVAPERTPDTHGLPPDDQSEPGAPLPDESGPSPVLAAPHRPGQSYWLSDVKSLPAEPMSLLKPVLIVAPQYPRRVRRHGTEGWVDLSFALAPTGQPLGIEIHDAEPAGIFDRSAIEAVRQWRFSGADGGRHIRTRLRFELEPGRLSRQ